MKVLFLVVVVADGSALVLLGLAAIAAIRVVLTSAPDHADHDHLRVAGRAQSASRRARVALGCFAISTLLLLVAVTGLLPDIVPGARCATGVLQATGGLGSRAITLRCLALALLGGWHLVDRLNHTDVSAPLTTAAARALLLATPIVVLAFVETLRARWSLDVSQPVDCCRKVYDQVWAPRGASGAVPRAAGLWLIASLAASALLAGQALVLARRSSFSRLKLSLAVAVLSLAWAPVAVLALVGTLAPYHFGVSHHHCPWCLFLREYYAVGYVLFGAVAVVALEGPAALLAARLAARDVAVRLPALARARAAGRRLLVALAVFWAVAALPALVWRLRVGAWLD